MRRVLAFVLWLAPISARAAETGNLLPDLVDIPLAREETLRSFSEAYLSNALRWEPLLEPNGLEKPDPDAPLGREFLRVPAHLLKRRYRPAKLILAEDRVMVRERDTSAWLTTGEGRILYDGDGLRTLAQARARVRFFDRSVLELEPNSLVILKPRGRPGYEADMSYGRLLVAEARVFVRGNGFVPRAPGTRFTLKRRGTRGSRVRVHHGSLGVHDARRRQIAVVNAGYQLDISEDGVPSAPVVFDRAKTALAPIEPDKGKPPGPPLDEPPVGVPVAGYRLQASKTRSFRLLEFDKVFDISERPALKDLGLAPGQYWFRTAYIDLIGDLGAWAEPEFQTLGLR